VMPIVFIAAIDGMSRIRAARTAGAAMNGTGPPRARRSGAARWPGQDATGWAARVADLAERHGAAMMLAICAALAFEFPLASLWSPQTYQLGPHVAAARAAMALVPDGSTVATDIDLLAPLGARADAFWLGNAATWLGQRGNPATQYVVYDQTAADLPAPSGTALSYIESLSRGVRYRQVYQQNGIFVFVRS